MLRFDWKDGLLMAGGFTALAVFIGVSRSAGFELSRFALQGIGGTFLLGPVALRRHLFGAPQLGEMRKGILPSLVSICGLFAIFFGIAAGAVATSRFSDPREKPDFLAEVRESYAVLGDVDVYFGPVESEAERAARLDEQRATREREMAALAKEHEAEWLARDREQTRGDWAFVAAGAGLLALGSLGLWARYEPLAPSNEPARVE